MIPPENNPMGTCADGYRGVLCADCDDGYYRKGDYGCGNCPHAMVVIVRLSILLFLLLCFIVLLVRLTLLAALQKKNYAHAYFRLLIDHIQLLFLAASFSFAWPSYTESALGVAKSIALSMNQYLAIDCIIGQGYEGVRIYYQKLFFFAVLPFAIGIIVFLFWRVFGRLGRIPVDMIYSRVITTVAIVLFLFHPTISGYMFSNFKCVEIDGQKRIKEDLEIECWSLSHNMWTYSVALPGLIVWALGLPFFAFLGLSFERKRLSMFDAKEKLGFLFGGFKKDFYFWEVVIMYRKVVVIFISVFI